MDMNMKKECVCGVYVCMCACACTHTLRVIQSGAVLKNTICQIVCY